MPAELFDEVAYVYDGTLEGLLSAIFAAYANHEHPTDVAPEGVLQPRLSQRVARIETNIEHAQRVRRGLCQACGHSAFNAVKKAALSSRPDAGTAAYRFVRYAMDQQKVRACSRCRKRSSCAGASGRGPCPKQRGRAISDITHPDVEPLFKIARSVDQECEHMRQFVRFEHLGGSPSAQPGASTPTAGSMCAQRHGSAPPEKSVDVWFARCNPRDSVVPLIMGHFVERFNVQPFIIYDENHRLAGVYDGRTWYLVRTDDPDTQLLSPEALPDAAVEEAIVQDAWRRFYRAVAVESRYNPELRRHFMPKRFWKNLTEMQQDTARATAAQAVPAKKQAAEANRRPAKTLEPATGIEPATH